MLEIIGKQSSMIHRHKYFIIKNIPLIPVSSEVTVILYDCMQVL